MYRCNRCERFCDDDWDVCTTDPKDPRELMCENCTADAEEADPVRGEFSQEQQAIIALHIAEAKEPA